MGGEELNKHVPPAKKQKIQPPARERENREFESSWCLVLGG